eukprot:4381938-Prymnesium_polylepis.1
MWVSNSATCVCVTGRRDEARGRGTRRACGTRLTWGRCRVSGHAPRLKGGFPTSDGSALQGGLGRDTPPAC